MGRGSAMTTKIGAATRGGMLALLATLAVAVLPAAAEARPTLADLVPNPAAQCQDIAATAPRNDSGRRLMGIVATLKSSEYGAALLQHARSRGVVLCLNHDGIHNAEYVEAVDAIAADPQLPDAELVGLLAHEMQHVWQASQGLGQDPRYKLKAAVALELEAEANAEAVRSLVEWQLALDGNTGPLQAHLRDERYGDIPRAFLTVARHSPTVSENIAALGVAHRQWSQSSWRVDGYTAYITDQVQRIAGPDGGDRLLPRALLGKLWGVAGDWRYQPSESSNRAIRAQLADGTPAR